MRGKGILLHISSLPGKCGIGTMGGQARAFADFLADCGQEYWQVLPVGVTSYGDSPYQSPSAFAGNPYFIDLEELCERALLKPEECSAMENAPAVDYGYQYERRYALLKTAYGRFAGGAEFERFLLAKRDWLEDFSLFMALKEYFGQAEWIRWPAWARLRNPEKLEAFRTQHAQEINFWKFTQYFFFLQWGALKRYANAKGVRLIGDMPIYAAYDSADVWAHRTLFELDGKGKPVQVAGVPPDAFSEDGQLWGNALYDWAAMRRDGYRWWIDRFCSAMELFDMVRIDHFRGFSAYYSVPYGEKSAKNGAWREGPGAELFEVCGKAVPSLNVIAEDLGMLDEEVVQLREAAGFPGMKVLQFAFDGNPGNPYLPQNCRGNCVVYTGTHDNPTTAQWYEELSAAERRRVRRCLRAGKGESGPALLIRTAMTCGAQFTIVPMQDYLELGAQARMNVPSVAQGNWRWRMPENCLTAQLKRHVRACSALFAKET